MKNPADKAAETRPAPSPLDDLESPADGWLEHLRRAERPRQGGRIGDYEILTELGRGAQGLVLRARHSATGRTVALKRLAAGALSSAVDRRRFEREIEVVASLSHPGIVSVYGVEEVDGVPLLSMEWVDGQALNEWAAARPAGRVGVRTKLELFMQVCAAVQHAHGQGVIHRDLKPSNILVDTSGRCRLLDFGLARRVTLEVEATRTLGFVGTPAYAAPECFRDDSVPNVRGDVYSLGVILFECLTGQRPFCAPNLRELIQEIEDREPPRASALAPGLDREIDAVVWKACAKAPERRYSTVDALQEDLRRYFDGRPVQAVPPSPSYLVRKWVLRNRMVFGLSLALVLALIGAALLGFRQSSVIAAERDRAQEALRAAQDQAQRAIAVQRFHLEALRSTIDPAMGHPTHEVDDLLAYTTAHVRERLDQYPDLAAEILAQVAQHYFVSNDLQRAEAVAKEGLEILDGLPGENPVIRADLTNLLGKLALSSQGLEAGRALLQESARLYESLPDKDPDEYAAILFQLGAAQLDVGEFAEADRNLSAALAIARSPSHVASASSFLTSLLVRRGRLDEAEKLADETFQRIARAAPSDSLPVALASASLAEVFAYTERLAEAVEQQERAVAIDRTLLAPGRNLLYELIRLGQYQAEAGQHAASLSTFEEVVRLAQAPDQVAAGAAGLALAHGALGHVDEVSVHARRAFGLVASGLPPTSSVEPLFLLFHQLVVAEQFEEAEGLFPRLAAVARTAAGAGVLPLEKTLAKTLDDMQTLGLEREFAQLFAELLATAGDRLDPKERAAFEALARR